MRRRLIGIATWVATMLCTLSAAQQPSTSAPRSRTGPPPASVAAGVPHQATLDRYCVTCHNGRLKTGGLAIEELATGNLKRDAEAWERVVRQLRIGSMPPRGLPGRSDNRLGEGATPFMRAARKADVSLMKILLEAGADPKLTQKSGNTPLMLAAGAVSGPGADAAERVTEAQARAAIEIGLAAGLDVNEVNATGDTVLHTAASTNGGLPDLIGFLAAAGARLDAKNKAERTPLDTALRARQPNEAAVARLRELAGSR